MIGISRVQQYEFDPATPSSFDDFGQKLPGQVSTDCGRWKWFASAVHGLDPLVHDLAELRVHGRFVVAMATRADDSRTLADETSILVRPLDQLNVPGAVLHDWDSPIANVDFVLSVTYD
jgi:hypothetical protein